jgi:outer membrane immunogenic protein
MKRILLAGIAALGLVGTASAADLAVKAPVAYVPVFTWTGCYLGANAGWIGGKDDYNTYRWYYDNGDYIAIPRSFSTNESAGTFGGQFGCQFQTGGWVIGGECDWNWSGLNEDTTLRSLDPNGFYYPADQTTHVRVDWFSTARARLGFAWDRVMIYATGGLAYASYDAYTHVDSGDPFFFRGGYHQNRFGYAVGGGLEWAFANNWTAKAEFLYLDFGAFASSRRLKSCRLLSTIGTPVSTPRSMSRASASTISSTPAPRLWSGFTEHFQAEHVASQI